MTKIKKIVAMALAFLMIFSSASVLANAWTVTVDDGFNLAIGTKFFINNGTDWVETEKVAPGDNVKARVYIGTDYYSNSSTLLFFYDKDFFEHSYAAGQNDLSVNSEAGAFTGKLNPNPVLDSQVTAGYIDSAFLNDYAAISVNLLMAAGSKNAMYDDSTWIFEFDLRVAESATGKGDLFVKDTTVQNSTSQNKALVNVPKGPADGTSADVWPMWRWNANVTLTSQPVSTLGTVTFDANGGKFADGKDEAVVSGDIKDDVTVPAAPTRDGYTFIGWVDATDTTPTYDEAKATVPVEKIPYDPVAYNAYWIKNVDITFNTDGGSEIAAHENVTPYTEFAAVEAPTKDGYTFVGWDVRGNMTLPETYPDVDTEYTAIWAKNVVVSFDTNGAAAIESIPGVAGEKFEAEIADPSKGGYRFVKWSPALPTVFPEDNTTYKAIFETGVHPVYYYVDGKLVSNIQVEYGTVVPTTIGTAVAPAGMTLSAWYKDKEMTQEFTAGTVMDTEKLSLYAKYEYNTYNAIFDANGGTFADGTTTVSIPTVYMDDIKAPAAPTKAGYEFAGWTPYAEGTFDEANDMYFYATWLETEKTVVYYADGYTPYYETFNLSTGEEFDVPAEPYKEGYTFLHWSETENGAEAIFPDVMPELETEEPLKYYAVFKINEYTITWDVDGETTKATYEYDELIEAVADPAKEGYTFAGWDGYTDGMKMPANDVTATATWAIESYTLKFDTDGGNAIDDITAEYNAPINVPADPTKEGHTFAGWNKEIYTVMPDLGDNGATETFKASWDVNNYTITWVVPGEEDDVDTYAYGADVTAPVPTKTGYVFAGWDAEVPATMPAENLVITGSWTPATDTKYTVNIHTMDAEGNYVTATDVLEGTTEATVNAVYTVEEGFELGANSVTSGEVKADGSLVLDVYLNRKTITISFNADGGSEVKAITGLYGAAVNVTEETTKKGYKFEEWQDIPATFPAADIEVTAIWSAKTFDATFNANGGQFGDGTSETKVPTVFNESIVAPADPTMKGHKFEGWTPAVDKMTEEGMEFTAVWSPKTFVATFDANGGTFADGSATATVETVFGEKIKAPANPTKAGYVFSTWSPAVGNMTEENMTFTAQWINATDTQYTVTIKTMNTAGEYEDKTATYGGETGALVKAEYTIEEGFKLSTEKESVTEGNILADSSLKLVVYIDRIEYKFAVDVDGDVTETKYLFGAAVATPVTPSKEGHTFDGWDGEVPATMPAKDVTVKATWTVNNYTITWVVPGQEDDVDTYAYGADVTAPVPTKTGYVFAGWDKEVPATMPAENLVITGSWTPATDTKYTVNIHTMGLDGEYEKVTDVLEGTTEAIVNAVYTVEDGFVLNEKSVTSGEVKADGSLVLDVYLDRKTVTITFANTGDSNTAAITGLFGTPVETPADPTWVGYTFDGWDKEIPGTIPAEDITITATWKTNNYTITWVVDGETKAIDGYDFGATIAPYADPVKDGYTFAGWAWTNEDGETVTASTTMPAYNVTATATWTAKDGIAYNVEIYKMSVDGSKYELADTKTLSDKAGAEVTYAPETLEGFTYNAEKSTVSGTVAGDGSLVLEVYYDRDTFKITINEKEKEYYYGEEIPEPTAPADKEGYEQDGWVDEKGNPVEFPLTVDTDNPTEIKPNWKVLSFNITWTVEGVDDVVTYEYDATITAPTAALKEGYRFVGWADETGAIATVPATMPAKDLKYTAVYEANVYSVNYYVDGKIVDTRSAEYGDTIVTTLETYTVPTGYSLDVWYTDAACETKLAEGAKVTATKTNLYTKTVANLYEAIFMVDGEVYDTVETAFDAEIIAPKDPTKDGYTFTGWTPVVSIMDTEGKTFEATWVATADAFTVTYKTEGMNDEIFTHAIGDEIDVPADPYKEGWTFLHWSLTEGGEKATIPETMPAENLVYYAVFSQSSFTVTWVIDGVEDVDTYEVGATITAPEAVKDGFEFKGWSLTADGELVTPETVMGTTNLKYYAVFEEVVVETVKIKLVPIEGSTGVVERNGVIESYNDGHTVTDAEYETPADFETYYVYGLTGRRINAASINTHFTVNDTENGYFVLENSELSGTFGTGAKIKVYDKNGTEDTTDDILVEEFYVIIFGDINGDSRINAADSTAFETELRSPTWSNRRNGVPYRIKAADLDLNGRIAANDASRLNNVLRASSSIDQTTGEAV